MNLQDLDSDMSLLSKPKFKLCLRTLYLYLVHDHNVPPTPNLLKRMPNALYSQIRYFVFEVEIWHRGQYKLRYVWQFGNRSSQKKQPASTGTSRCNVLEHSIWGTVLGLCRALKGCFFASAIFFKKGLMFFMRMGDINVNLSKWWTFTGKKLINSQLKKCFIEQIFHHMPFS